MGGGDGACLEKGGRSCGCGDPLALTAENSKHNLLYSTMTCLGSMLCGSSVFDEMTFVGATTITEELCISTTGPSHKPWPAFTNAHVSTGVTRGQSGGAHQWGKSDLTLTFCSVEGYILRSTRSAAWL